MDKKNLMMFLAVSMSIMLVWSFIFPPPTRPETATTQQQQTQQQAPKADALLKKGEQIAFETDVFKGAIDANGGDIRDLYLQKFNATDDENKSMQLLSNNDDYVYITRTGLISGATGDYLFKDIPFKAEQQSYKMTGDKLDIKLSATENGLTVDKIYTFTKGSYVIGLNYAVHNESGQPVNLSAVYSLIRDGKTPVGESKFVHTYTGPVVYTPEGKFQKIAFGDLDKAASNNRNPGNYVEAGKEGWVGMIQHYFISTWLMNPKNQEGSSCGANDCRIEVKKRSTDGLYSVGLRADQPAVANGQTAKFGMSLYAGPAESKTVTAVAENLHLTKDFGKVHIFSSPLFWMLDKAHDLVQNWGWAIILLTVVVKIILLPLTAASYRSMAKMRNVAPRMQILKEQCGEDKVKFQQEMMALYKREKINPLGGCLPIFLQIPIFIGLYWALLSSVELRQAPWILWIHDLGRTDPYFVLPTILGATMIVQSFLNPPPPDPMQAKMMKIMPVAFSVMFYFFPAGLVLYYIVNNLLSMLQQWLINKKIAANPHPAHHKD